MELIKPKYRIRCEFGVCKNFANMTIKHSRLGIGGALNICSECAKGLMDLLKNEFKTAKKEEVVKADEDVETKKTPKSTKNKSE
ncbi:MAG: hypothetical protein FWC11_03125 [Firmicutes bacterium]|nr:hypothetical protein [Bacillota bacterium]